MSQLPNRLLTARRWVILVQGRLCNEWKDTMCGLSVRRRGWGDKWGAVTVVVKTCVDSLSPFHLWFSFIHLCFYFGPRAHPLTHSQIRRRWERGKSLTKHLNDISPVSVLSKLFRPGEGIHWVEKRWKRCFPPNLNLSSSSSSNNTPDGMAGIQQGRRAHIYLGKNLSFPYNLLWWQRMKAHYPHYWTFPQHDEYPYAHILSSYKYFLPYKLHIKRVV